MPSELRGQEFPEWSVTPSDRGFSIRGKRTEGVGHKPDALHTSWGATRRQRYSGARSEGAPLLTRLGTAADSQFGSVATRGKGRWLAAYQALLPFLGRGRGPLAYKRHPRPLIRSGGKHQLDPGSAREGNQRSAFAWATAPLTSPSQPELVGNQIARL